MRLRTFLLHLAITACACLAVQNARADETVYSTNLYGALGLNTVPSARMDETGTVRAGVSTLDPYAHTTLGFQIARPLSITLRQSAEISGLLDDADRLYPGLDLRLRLMKESAHRPDLTIGLQSAIGHKRMAAEYLAASKRFGDFDFTAGLGWGRMGSAKHLGNPFKALLGHFDRKRTLDGETSSGANNWFTGDDIGIFGGVEYFTPVRGLSLKADWNADDYTAEKTAIRGFSAPAPWGLGLSYSPAHWINLGVAAQGTNKIMARLSLQDLLGHWPDRTRDTGYTTLMPRRSASGDMARMRKVSTAERNGPELRGLLPLHGQAPAPQQIGAAAVDMANNAGPDIEKLTLVPEVMGLQGPSVGLMRSDLEQAMRDHQGSPEEIWRHASFEDTRIQNIPGRRQEPGWMAAFHNLQLESDTQASLSEEDNGLLYRTALLARTRTDANALGFITGLGLRLNIADNLDRLHGLRPRVPWPVRSDIDDFAARSLAVEQSYLGWTHSIRPDLHVALSAGYLEEMYAGTGGEILYRPFGSRFALGVEAWLAFKRDPSMPLNLGVNGDHILTAHLNGWYDVPGMDVTLHARAGRYLAEDVGVTLGLEKIFGNGAKLEGFTTITNAPDFDLYGGTTHAYHGLRLALPLGSFRYLQGGASIKARAEPFGRDTGQALENPLPLHELTERFSYSHLAENWNRILPVKDPEKPGTKKEPPGGG